MSLPADTLAEVGKHLGDYRWERVTVSFLLQKDHVGVGCETHRGDRELCQGLMEEPGTGSGLGQGCGRRGELVWELATDSGGADDSPWGTRRAGAWETPVLPNQTWVRLAECSKASLLTLGVVKGSAALIVKVPIQGEQAACALNPRTP